MIFSGQARRTESFHAEPPHCREAAQQASETSFVLLEGTQEIVLITPCSDLQGSMFNAPAARIGAGEASAPIQRRNLKSCTSCALAVWLSLRPLVSASINACGHSCCTESLRGQVLARQQESNSCVNCSLCDIATVGSRARAQLSSATSLWHQNSPFQRACSHKDDHCVKYHWPRTSSNHYAAVGL
ncbi:hypothetical protein WJX82_000061 [Trebouxia sp. C0006]